jgi:hypothetical protein
MNLWLHFFFMALYEKRGPFKTCGYNESSQNCSWRADIIETEKHYNSIYIELVQLVSLSVQSKQNNRTSTLFFLVKLEKSRTSTKLDYYNCARFFLSLLIVSFKNSRKEEEAINKYIAEKKVEKNYSCTTSNSSK